MSLNSPSTGPSYLPRRNRAAYPQELAILDEERGLDDVFIKSLRTELEIRKIRANSATVDVQHAATSRLKAELRLRAANSVKNILIKAMEGLSDSFSVDESLIDGLRSLGSDNSTPHLEGATDILAIRRQCEEFIEMKIGNVALGILLAYEALKKCIEEEEVAMAREERCVGVISNIEKCISEMEDMCRSQLTRPIWRLPESIWCQIFVDVIDDVTVWNTAEEAPPSGSISYPSLTLSAVCHLWRTIAQGYPVLWRTVHLGIDPFTHCDTERIRHYTGLRENQALRIIIDVPPTTSTDQVELAARLLSGVGNVDHLAVRGGATGKDIVQHLSVGSMSPKALTVSFSDDCPFQRLNNSHQIANNLEKLTLKNCSLTGIIKPGRRLRKMTRFRLFNTTSLRMNWSSFYERFLSMSDTVRELVLVTLFSNATPPNTEPKLLSRLTSMTTDFSVLLLFYNSRLYTPVLKSLTIAGAQFVDNEEWCAYAEDQNGGANITDVDFAPSFEVTVEATSTLAWSILIPCLRLLPKLSTLSLQAEVVDPILKAMKELNTRPLGALRVLSITDYDGTGQDIASVARKYLRGEHSDSDSESDVSLIDKMDVLKVELQNCPNISDEVVAELIELGPG